ncbi:hypothetical protein NIES4073_34670 [Kalymmatonema gypsitolerans NIES-4073]|nr:hypothetical protein NIES4073_34670 [Scytonema sp. NIES-4073]
MTPSSLCNRTELNIKQAHFRKIGCLHISKKKETCTNMALMKSFTTVIWGYNTHHALLVSA